MNVSIIYCFRDREIERVQRSFKSIYNQLEEKDEIIFIDYGSHQDLSKTLSNYFSEYKKIKYIYFNARGLLWNRGHALNIGVKHSKNNSLITADIDLIYSSNFLEKIKKEFLDKDLLNYNCYYLPKRFSDYTKIQNKPQKVAKKLKASPETALGLMIVKKELFNKVNGYDEYYKVWGAEDNDLIFRFKKLGVESSWFVDNSVFVFHQWHESSSFRNNKVMPNGWSNQMLSHFNKCSSAIVRSEKWGETRERSIFDIKKFDLDIDISKEVPLYYSQVMNSLVRSNNEYSTFRFFAEAEPNVEKSKLNRFITSFNTLSNKLKLPVLLESEVFYFSKYRRLIEYRDLFYYFVLFNDHLIADYSIEEKSDIIELKVKIDIEDAQ